MSMESLRNVLLVDDSVINIDIMLEILADDYELSVAMDAESALECIADVQADLIVLDIVMPEMSGYELCDRLRQDPQYKTIPIVFVTSRDEGEMAQRLQQARDAGEAWLDCVYKPIDAQCLQEKVRAALASD